MAKKKKNTSKKDEKKETKKPKMREVFVKDLPAKAGYFPKTYVKVAEAEYQKYKNKYFMDAKEYKESQEK